jgi:hypothetical protein
MLQITHTGKQQARQLLLNLFSRKAWPQPLKILTMPSVFWEFERMLLTLREPGWMLRSQPRRTFLTSLENDQTRFRSGFANMPGISTPDAIFIQSQFTFACHAVRTHYAEFLLTDALDFLAYKKHPDWDAVWLDFQGPLSDTNLEIIRKFYRDSSCQILTVTALKARWNKQTNNAIKRYANHSAWLHHALDGNVLHDFEYYDTSPMTQFCVQKQGEVT